MLKFNLLFIVFAGLLLACSSDEENPNSNPNSPSNPAAEWLIPSGEVFDGGPGKDGIPSIDNPQFTKASDVDFMNDDWLVTAMVSNGEVKAYPHPILDWHEIVNDRIGNKEVAVTYCPLTGTGIAWDRMINGTVTTFGVSGLLYNSNLMPYDRLTNSTWSQQRLDCVNGELIGERINTYSLVETNWKTWKTSFPDSDVLNTNTGHNRVYGNYPYGDYRTNHDRVLFPVSIPDDRLPAKERVLGVIINDQSKVYPFQSSDSGLELINDQLSTSELIIVRSVEHNFIVSFVKPGGQEFTLVENDLPYILENQDGERFDILGQAESNSSFSLLLPEQFIGYWFSWGTFYRNIEIFQG